MFQPAMLVYQSVGGGNSNMVGIFIPKIGEDGTQFDDHIFQMGWFNHQLDEVLLLDH